MARWQQSLAALADCQANTLRGALLVYTRAISMLDRSNQWQHALACLGDLQAKVVQADTILYNSVAQLQDLNRASIPVGQDAVSCSDVSG